jgi:hypothetical protein
MKNSNLPSQTFINTLPEERQMKIKSIKIHIDGLTKTLAKTNNSIELMEPYCEPFNTAETAVHDMALVAYALDREIYSLECEIIDLAIGQIGIPSGDEPIWSSADDQSDEMDALSSIGWGEDEYY